MIWIYQKTLLLHLNHKISEQTLWLYSTTAGSGKSTIGDIFRGFFGKTLATTIPGDKIGEFGLERIPGKFFIHGDDIKDPTFIDSNYAIKTISSNQEEVQINIKGKTHSTIDARYVSVIVTSNEQPSFKASDLAMVRRMLVIRGGEKNIRHLFFSEELTQEGIAAELPYIISNGKLLMDKWLKEKKMTDYYIPWDIKQTQNAMPGIVAEVKDFLEYDNTDYLKKSKLQELVNVFLKRGNHNFSPKTVIMEMEKLGLITVKNHSGIDVIKNTKIKFSAMEEYLSGGMR